MEVVEYTVITVNFTFKSDFK